MVMKLKQEWVLALYTCPSPSSRRRTEDALRWEGGDMLSGRADTAPAGAGMHRRLPDPGGRSRRLLAQASEETS